MADFIEYAYGSVTTKMGSGSKTVERSPSSRSGSNWATRSLARLPS